MRCVGRVRAFCVTAAALLCGGSPTAADPLNDVLLPSASNLSGGAYPEKFLYFSGFDLWRSGGSFYGGIQWAPGGLNQDGFTLKVLLAQGSYRYLAGSTNIRGTSLLGAVLPGWRIKRGDFEIKVFAGPDFQNHRLSPDDPGNSLRGNHVGLRIGADLWWEPTATNDAGVIDLQLDHRQQLRCAWRRRRRVMDRFWAGPEIETSGDEVYRQYRIGAHLTSFKMAAFEWSIGAGYVQDNSHRSGVYGRIGLLTRR